MNITTQHKNILFMESETFQVPTRFKVKIIQSSKPSYWYADKINSIFEVTEGLDCNKYQVINTIKTIDKQDCFII
jgi:hypothetical protein